MEAVGYAQLKKNCKKEMRGMPVLKLALLGDCSTQHLAVSLRGSAFDKGINLDIWESDYNQIEAQTIDETSEFYRFSPEFTVIQLCAEKLCARFYDLEQTERSFFASQIMEEIQTLWCRNNCRMDNTILQFNFVELDDRIQGDYANRSDQSLLYQMRRLNQLLMDGCRKFSNVYIVDLCGIENQYGRRSFFDEKLWYLARMPISLELLPAVSERTLQTICALNGRIQKCIIMDLDNTLWGGTIGEDGLNGIQIGELGMGQVFSELQRWLKELKKRGILLAVCSKNDEEIAKEPFLNHPEMVLSLEDISVFVANWQDKAHNIQEIQKQLNIGMDSIVFLDDSLFERNAARQLIPEITVPELPGDPALWLRYLQNLNLFETASLSQADQDRTDQYRAEFARRTEERQYRNFDDYLKSLQMQGQAKPFDPFHYSRIAQLTQRSNQFNLRTVRYTEAEVRAAAEALGTYTLYFTLSDRLGDHGLVSAVILKKRDDTFFVENWQMSCRVLKRGMEEFVVNRMVSLAHEKGCRKITGEYVPTSKNRMVASVYEKLGFQALGNGLFELEVDSFRPNKTWIKEMHD